jgi:hypothetical protein
VVPIYMRVIIVDLYCMPYIVLIERSVNPWIRRLIVARTRRRVYRDLPSY